MHKNFESSVVTGPFAESLVYFVERLAIEVLKNGASNAL